MGKREELLRLLKSYADDRYITKESTYLREHFMKGVFSTIAEFVFDDEKTKWFSPYQAPQNNTPVLAKYTDGEEPIHEVIEFVDGKWWNPNEVRRPFVWTRIPE